MEPAHLVFTLPSTNIEAVMIEDKIKSYARQFGCDVKVMNGRELKVLGLKSHLSQLRDYLTKINMDAGKLVE